MIIALTGHRPHKFGPNPAAAARSIRAALRGILEEKRPERVISGMALGADTIWAEEALQLQIPVTAAIPFVGQESLWSARDKLNYEEILAHPLVTKVICAPGGASTHKYHHRNKWLVDHSDALVSVWDGTAGGTRHCLLYAQEVGKPIIYVRPLGVERTEWAVEPQR